MPRPDDAPCFGLKNTMIKKNPYQNVNKINIVPVIRTVLSWKYTFFKFLIRNHLINLTNANMPNVDKAPNKIVSFLLNIFFSNFKFNTIFCLIQNID